MLWAGELFDDLFEECYCLRARLNSPGVHCVTCLLLDAVSHLAIELVLSRICARDRKAQIGSTGYNCNAGSKI